MIAAVLPPELQTVDRWLVAWGSSGGAIAPTNWPGDISFIRATTIGDFIPKGNVWLHPEIAEIDTIVRESPLEIGALLGVWYRCGVSASEKARILKIHRTAIYERWRGALWYVHGALRHRGRKAG